VDREENVNGGEDRQQELSRKILVIQSQDGVIGGEKTHYGPWAIWKENLRELNLLLKLKQRLPQQTGEKGGPVNAR